MRDSSDPAIAKGTEVRREMFGDELVDANFVNGSDFQRPIQEWVSGAVWADVWTRGVLDRHTRSLVTIALVASVNRPLELERHILAGLTNGCTAEEIQELLLHVAPYCGAPSAMSAFRLAEEVLTAAGAIGTDSPSHTKGK